MSDAANQDKGQDVEKPHGTDAPADKPADKPADDPNATETLEALRKELEDFKAHSRKWEERAKANKDAAEALEALKREKMTDEERRAADFDALTKERDEATAAREAAEAALTRFRIATEFGLTPDDVEVLASVSDEKALRALAERLSNAQSNGPRPNPGQGRGGKAPATNGDRFADVFADFFHN